MFDIRARYGERNKVLRLAGCGTGMAPYAASVVYDLGPLDLLGLTHEIFVTPEIRVRKLYHLGGLDGCFLPLAL
jgi:hypothetical protein